MGLTEDQFIDFCILIGNDYNTRPAKVGPKTALALIKEHGNIEAILEAKSRYDFSPIKDVYPQVRNLFKFNGKENDHFNPAAPNIDVKALTKFLKEKNFQPTNIRRSIDVLCPTLTE